MRVLRPRLQLERRSAGDDVAVKTLSTRRLAGTNVAANIVINAARLWPPVSCSRGSNAPPQMPWHESLQGALRAGGTGERESLSLGGRHLGDSQQLWSETGSPPTQALGRSISQAAESAQHEPA
jgi:hypothetical protein